MITVSVVAIAGLSLAVYFIRVNGGRAVPTAPNWFVLVNGLLLVGILQIFEPADPVDLRFALTHLGGLLAFIGGAWLINLRMRTTPSRAVAGFIRQPVTFDLRGRAWQFSALPLLALSLVVCVAFAISLGYHVGLAQVLLFGTSISGEDLRRSYGLLRTEVHYGGRYLYIGYVTQFKDFILPTITAFLLVRTQHRGGLSRWLGLAILLLANLYFLTITGQRRPVLVFSVVLAVLSLSRWAVLRTPPHGRRLVRVLASGVAAVAIAMFFAVSAIRGLRTEQGAGVVLAEGLSSLWGRVGPVLAADKLRLAHLMADRPPSWGRDWLGALVTVMPGHESGQATELHAMLYGSERGAAGLMVWESLWTNFGWLGIVGGGLLLGVLLQWLTFRTWSGPRYASKHVVLIYASLQLGLVTDPYSLLNGGVVTLGLLYLLYRYGRESRVASIGSRRGIQRSLVSRTPGSGN